MNRDEKIGAALELIVTELEEIKCNQSRLSDEVKQGFERVISVLDSLSARLDTRDAQDKAWRARVDERISDLAIGGTNGIST